MCSPVAHRLKSSGEALLKFVTKCRSWNAAFPAPAPPVAEEAPPPVVTCATPHEKDSTSIHSVYCLSRLSPGIPSSFRNASNAIAAPSRGEAQLELGRPVAAELPGRLLAGVDAARADVAAGAADDR